uniref:Uncharacterized protein n=1 Tax=Timema poppense TaxID=170557 RepID=A0A7R9GZC3_TIMPO|nr:unnamed protein product [Timema poppensis]
MKKVVPSCTPKPGPLGSSFKDVNPPLGSAANLPLLGPALTAHPTEIRTSISPSSSVELNTTSALANYAIEAVSNFSDERGMVVYNKQDLSFRC